MTTNDIDAIEMARRIRDAIYEQIKDKTPAERLAYYREQAKTFHERLGVHVPRKPDDRHEAVPTSLDTEP